MRFSSIAPIPIYVLVLWSTSLKDIMNKFSNCALSRILTAYAEAEVNSVRAFLAFRIIGTKSS